jgi:FtsH-binding integral membrane protein
MSDGESEPLRPALLARRTPLSAELRQFLFITYMLVWGTLLIIFGFSVAALLISPLQSFIFARPWVLWTSLSILLSLLVSNTLLPEMWSAVPAIAACFFFLLVCCVSYSFGALSSLFTTSGVAMAIGLTIFISATVSAFALLTPTDFTGAFPYLIAALSGLALSAILLIVLPSPLAAKLGAALGGLLFSFFLLFDTQLLMRDVVTTTTASGMGFGTDRVAASASGGRRCNLFRRPRLTTSSYVAAAARLLLDIFNVYALFLFAIGIVRNRRTPV